MSSHDERAPSPQSLALAFDRYVSARWRGEDRAVEGFAAWFEAHWTDASSPEPEEPPAAAKVLGNASGGIRWYVRDDVVQGYLSGRDEGCYRIARDEAVPLIPAPWEDAPTAAAATDRLLHQAGDPSLVAGGRGRAAGHGPPRRRSPSGPATLSDFLAGEPRRNSGDAAH